MQVKNKLPTGLLDTKETHTNIAPKANSNTNNFSIEAILGIKPSALKSNSPQTETVYQKDSVSVAKETNKTKPVEKATTFQNTDKSYSYFQTEVERRPTNAFNPETRNPSKLRMSVESQSSDASIKSHSNNSQLRSHMEEAAAFQNKLYDQIASMEAHRKSLMDMSLKGSAGERNLQKIFGNRK